MSEEHRHLPKPATIIDVARLAGVSKSTVSRVLRGEDRVAEETREKVRQAAAELRYTPDTIAQRMRTGPDRSIGLVVSTVDVPVHGQLNRYLHEDLRDRGYHVLQAMILGTDQTLVKGQIDNILGLQVQGLIIAAGAVSDELLVDYAARIPLVLGGAPAPELPINNIAYDGERDGRTLIDHLHGLGHRTIVIQAEARSRSRGTWARAEAASARARSLGMEVHVVDVFGVDDDVEHVRRALALGATAIVCAYDTWLFRTWRAVRALGLDAPEDISLTGVDGVTDGVDLLGATTIRHPVEELSRRVADRITEMIEAPREADTERVRRYLPGELLTGSTGVPASGSTAAG